MNVDIDDFAARALELPLKQRAALVRRLLASLEEPSAEESDQLWIEEVRTRRMQYLSGRLDSRPAAEVLVDVRESLK